MSLVLIAGEKFYYPGIPWLDSVCAEQMKSLETKLAEFERLNAVPLGLSIDAYPSKNAWAKELGIAAVKLLADFWPHGGVATAYGLFREEDGFPSELTLLLLKMAN